MLTARSLLIRFIAILVSDAVVIALVIAGWGGLSPILSRPALIATFIVLLALSLTSVFAGGHLSPGLREDRSNRWVIPVLAGLGTVNLYVPALTDRLNVLTIGGDGVRWLGVVLFALGGALRLWPVFVLGDRFSGLVAIQPGHKLVTGGIYAVIRHPSYAGLLVGSLGWSLAFRALAGVLLTLAQIVPIVARIKAEERLLLSEFGGAYADLQARTWRLIPGVW